MRDTRGKRDPFFGHKSVLVAAQITPARLLVAAQISPASFSAAAQITPVNLNINRFPQVIQALSQDPRSPLIRLL